MADHARDNFQTSGCTIGWHPAPGHDRHDPIAKAFGLPRPLERELKPFMFQRLQGAGARAMKVQARRPAGKAGLRPEAGGSTRTIA